MCAKSSRNKVQSWRALGRTIEAVLLFPKSPLAVWMKKGLGGQDKADAPPGWPGLLTVENSIDVVGLDMLKTEQEFSKEQAGQGDKDKRKR